MVRKQIYPNGAIGWIVDCRFDGKGDRFTFKSKIEAQTAVEQAKVKRQNEGQGAFSMYQPTVPMPRKPWKLLRPHSRTLRESAAFFLKHLAIVKRELSVADLVTELLASKASDGASEPYLKDLRTRLRLFASEFGGAKVAGVSTAVIDDWLRALKVGPVSRNNVRRVLGVLFNYVRACRRHNLGLHQTRCRSCASKSSRGGLNVSNTADASSASAACGKLAAR